jgi:hypothetical protein
MYYLRTRIKQSLRFYATIDIAEDSFMRNVFSKKKVTPIFLHHLYNMALCQQGTTAFLINNHDNYIILVY